jgi:hypothetical protein
MRLPQQAKASVHVEDERGAAPMLPSGSAYPSDSGTGKTAEHQARKDGIDHGLCR